MQRRYAFIAVVFSLLSMGVGIALTTVRAESGPAVGQGAGIGQGTGIASTAHSFVVQTDDRVGQGESGVSGATKTRKPSKFDKMLRNGSEMTTRANASAAIQSSPFGQSSAGGQEISSWSTSSSLAATQFRR